MQGGASFDQARAARYALAVLTFINLFNYLDRWVVAAVVESIKKSELHLTDTQIGLIPTGFIIIYTITSPLFGTFGDRARRPPLIAFGVAVWSLATALGGFARWFAGRCFNPRSWFLRFGAQGAAKQTRSAIRSSGALALLTEGGEAR